MENPYDVARKIEERYEDYESLDIGILDDGYTDSENLIGILNTPEGGSTENEATYSAAQIKEMVEKMFEVRRRFVYAKADLTDFGRDLLTLLDELR